MKHFTFALLFILSLALPSRLLAAEWVNVLNWPDYIDPRVIEDFTKETGIEVAYDTFDSDAAIESRLMLGNPAYDVVFPSGPVLRRAIEANLLQRLDPGKLPNANNLSQQIMSDLAIDDPGNRYAVNYAWFTAGIAYDVDKARDRLGDQPLDSWDIIFKPENLQKFADCGIEVLDDAQDLFAIALIYMRVDPQKARWIDIRRAADLLSLLHRNVKKFHSSDYINALANGDICLAVGWSGDAALARSRAREADNGLGIGYVVPKEGSVIALDNMAIPANAPHPAAAYALINFLLRPDIAARNTAATGFANGLTAPLLASDKGNPTSADPAATLYAVRAYPAAVQKFIEREWTQITK
ncbi:MAG TPA: extracellular solute-binding protein [Methylovirgula sp.]|nr:extracellular solute-binding protein [Methylovirgula sp.]